MGNNLKDLEYYENYYEDISFNLKEFDGFILCDAVTKDDQTLRRVEKIDMVLGDGYVVSKKETMEHVKIRVFTQLTNMKMVYDFCNGNYATFPHYSYDVQCLDIRSFYGRLLEIEEIRGLKNKSDIDSYFESRIAPEDYENRIQMLKCAGECQVQTHWVRIDSLSKELKDRRDKKKEDYPDERNNFLIIQSFNNVGEQ